MNKVGFSKDIHNLKPGGQLTIGGVVVSNEISVIAYSDGDVLLHALSESILGALGLEDIGTYFNKKTCAQNFDSVIILNFALEKMNELKVNINNVDIMIMLDNIILKENKSKIKNNISKLMNIDASKISIKASTTENNFINFIECNAIVSLEIEE